MRKLQLLLLGLLLLIGCGGADNVVVLTVEVDGSESRGAEQAARATPLPPRDKATPLALSNVLTVTQSITSTESISTTVRGETTETESTTKRIRCLAAQHATDEGD